MKKNGGGHPTGSCARSRTTATHHLHGPAQDRSPGSGSRRDAGALGYASGRSRSLDGVAEVSRAGPAHPTVPLRTASRLSRIALENGADRGGPSRSIPALLSVLALPA